MLHQWKTLLNLVRAYTHLRNITIGGRKKLLKFRGLLIFRT